MPDAQLFPELDRPVPPSEAAVRPPSGRVRELHYRAAMRAARSIGRSPRRDQAGRLICHHLRCMLGE